MDAKPRIGRSLSGRVLALTIAVVLLTEVMVLLPSLGRERRAWLSTRLREAELAAMSVAIAPRGVLDLATRNALLRLSGTEAVRLEEPGRNVLILEPKPGLKPAASIDLDRESVLAAIRRAVELLFARRDRMVLVSAKSALVPSTLVEVMVHEAPLARHLAHYAQRIALLSLLIATVTGALVYLALIVLLVRPMQRLTGSITAFRADPERSLPLDPTALGRFGGEEIAVAARELAGMQQELRAAFWRNARLAALGQAVAQISHDLRGLLTSALLVADRLKDAPDPSVHRAGEMLVRAVERAADMVGRTLDYAREGPPALMLAQVPIAALIEETAEVIRPVAPLLTIESRLDPELKILVDRAQFLRVLLNLARNACEAGARRLMIEAESRPAGTVLTIADDGPGLPEAARANLFRPFAGGVRRGGSGLGLAIARDLTRAHGGDIELAETGPQGTTFRLTLPAAGVVPKVPEQI